MLDTSRKEVWDIIWAQIKEHPFIGQGLCADRYILQNNRYASYPHNFVLELLVQYGFVFGGFIILNIILVLIRSFLIKDSARNILIPLAITILIMFSFSKSIWTSYEI